MSQIDAKPTCGLQEAVESFHAAYNLLPSSIKELPGERDLNFRVQLSDGREFVFKIGNPTEPREYLDVQTCALQRLSMLPYIPRPLPTVEGELLSEVGTYTNVISTLNGEEVRVPTLLHPEQTKVYECLPGISPEQAERTGKPAGPSFHFVLNDVTIKDNRIPPRGFKNAAFKAHHCEPVDADYADGQHWDDTRLEVPEGAVLVSISHRAANEIVSPGAIGTMTPEAASGLVIAGSLPVQVMVNVVAVLPPFLTFCGSVVPYCFPLFLSFVRRGQGRSRLQEARTDLCMSGRSGILVDHSH